MMSPLAQAVKARLMKKVVPVQTQWWERDLFEDYGEKVRYNPDEVEEMEEDDESGVDYTDCFLKSSMRDRYSLRAPRKDKAFVRGVFILDRGRVAKHGPRKPRYKNIDRLKMRQILPSEVAPPIEELWLKFQSQWDEE
jgi:hypothetical protein